MYIHIHIHNAQFVKIPKVCIYIYLYIMPSSSNFARHINIEFVIYPEVYIYIMPQFVCNPKVCIYISLKIPEVFIYIYITPSS